MGRGTALFVHGECAGLETSGGRPGLAADGDEHPVVANVARAGNGCAEFWGLLALEPPPRTVDVRLVVTLRDGGRAAAELGTVELVPGVPSAGQAPPPPGPRGEPLIAICMATFDPPPELFERQIESLRAQTHRNWVCVVSDDGSSEERFAAIERAIRDDPRFAVSRSAERLGFYRNFERALAMAPPTARYVALADQDDRWHPDKLEVLRDAIGPAQLAYSDARAIRPDGGVLSETLWSGRRNNRTDLVSLLISNTVTGAAALLRRELLDLALPLPPAPGVPYHDHWLALVALATGELAYVDRPLLDYVQHPGAVLGAEAIAAPRSLTRRARLRRLLGDPGAALERWRGAYFDEWCRTLVFARVLEMRCGELMSAPKRRGVERVLTAEGSPRSLAWLAARPARSLVGRNETKGFEHRLLRGILWRHLARVGDRRARGEGTPPAA